MIFLELITSLDIGFIFGIVAIGIFLTFRTINFVDMTCDGSFVLGAAVSAVLIKNGFNPFLALIASIISGGIAGFLTAVLNIKFKIKDLLAGIIVAFMLYSINLRIMSNSPNITFTDNDTVFSAINPTIVLLIIMLILTTCLVFLLKSSFGLKLRAVGYNRRFASVFGINVDLMTLFGLILSNSLIALGGAMFSQYQGFCDISQGIGTLVTGLASVVIGQKILPFRIEPKLILSCIVGSVLYRIFISVALHSDILWVRTQDLNLITGIIIVAIMLTKKSQNAKA